MTSVGLPATLLPASRSRFPHRPRALFGFFAAPGVSLEDLTDGLAAWRGRHDRARVGVRIAGTEADLQDSVGSMVGEEIAPLDGFATIDVDNDEPDGADLDALVASVAGIGDALSGVIDRDRSFAMAGLVNLVLADDAPFAMMLMCAHRPGVELAATHEWWCSFGEVMAQFPAGPTVGYHQVQCDPELSGRAASAAGLAATAYDLGDLAYLTSIDEFVAGARAHAQSDFDPGPPVNQRDEFITFRGSVGAFCSMLEG